MRTWILAEVYAGGDNGLIWRKGIRGADCELFGNVSLATTSSNGVVCPE